MRIKNIRNEYNEHFAKQLLQIGEGKIKPENDSNEIIFPKNFCKLVTSKINLIASVYPQIEQNFVNVNWLAERALVAPRNEEVNHLNSEILSKLPGEIRMYSSFDSTVDEFEAVNYPVEFLHTLNPSGLAPHKLKLKIGSIVMLLRNLNPPKLCNGTRLIVTHLRENLIVATIVTGIYKNETVFIPRIPMITTDLTFDFKRIQFPIKLAFAITINKSQGQSLECVGVYLEKPCFSHGQLYVACSRVGSANNLYIYTPTTKTKNIVFPIVLQ